MTFVAADRCSRSKTTWVLQRKDPPNGPVVWEEPFITIYVNSVAIYLESVAMRWLAVRIRSTI